MQANLSVYGILQQIFRAWRLLSRQRQKLRVCLQMQRWLRSHKLRFYWNLWKQKDTECVLHEGKMKERASKVLYESFLTWCVYTLRSKRVSKWVTTHGSVALCRRIITRLRRFLFRRRHLAQVYRRRKLLGVAFKSLRNDEAVCMLNSEICRGAFDIWKLASSTRARFREGLMRLINIWLHLRIRFALYVWPGRRSFRLAEEMRRSRNELSNLNESQKSLLTSKESPLSRSSTYVSRCNESRDLFDGSSSAGILSFIQPRSLNLVEQMIKLGFVRSKKDYTVIQGILRTLRTTFCGWRHIVSRAVAIMKRGRLVAFWKAMEIKRLVLLNWVYLTPTTSHRVIIWTLPRRHLKITHSQSSRNAASFSLTESGKNTVSNLAVSPM